MTILFIVTLLYRKQPYINPDRKALMVKPGKNNPGENIRQPRISAIEAINPPLNGPNSIEYNAIGRKPKLIRINVVWIEKMCVKRILKAMKIAENTRE